MGPMPDGPIERAHAITNISPISPAGGFNLHCSINGRRASFLLYTGAAVTLLRKDTWDRVNAQSPSQELEPWSGKGLVGEDGSQLTVHGTARVLLELPDRKVPADVVVVTPLISEGILGLDYLQKKGASIDLERGQMRLNWSNCTLTFHPANGSSSQSVRVRHRGGTSTQRDGAHGPSKRRPRDMDPGRY